MLKILRGLDALLHYGLRRPDIILGNRGSTGDAILLTTLLRELHRTGKRAAILTDYPELYRGLPFGAACLPADTPVLSASRWLRIPVHHIQYAKPMPEEHAEYPPKQHILAEMCAHAGLDGEIDLRPYFSLTEDEKAAAAGYQGTVVVQSTCLTARYKMWTKDWGADRMQQVVERLSGDRRVVQLGASADPHLVGAEDCRGLPFRKVAAILSQADLFVGLVGFLMHLARAVDTPAVIVYGGREKPWQSGYSCNVNLASDVPCSPCWRYEDCAGGKICMDLITVDAVVAEVESALAKPKGPLPAQRVALQASTI